VQQYVDLVNAAVGAAHGIGSPVPIIAVALAGADVGYLNQMYADGMHGQGGISMHPYTLRPATGFLDPLKSAERSGASPSIFRASIADVHDAMLAAGDPDWNNRFGLLQRDFAPRPSYSAVRRTLRGFNHGRRHGRR
jgi:hypothetical protein